MDRIQLIPNLQDPISLFKHLDSLNYMTDLAIMITLVPVVSE